MICDERGSIENEVNLINWFILQYFYAVDTDIFEAWNGINEITSNQGVSVYIA